MLSPFVSPKNIVVATDLTDLDRLLPYAIAQAQFNDAKVWVVHAASPLVLAHGSQREEPNRCDALNCAARQLQAAGVRCSITVERGLPLAVVQYALKQTASARLLIGTHSHGDTGQQIIGSVANALLREVRLPVFVIGPRASVAVHELPHSILHTVSFSGDFREHAEFASEVAEAHNAALILLHVVHPDLLTGSYVREHFLWANHVLSGIVPSSHRLHVQTVVECGEPVQEVRRIASLTGCDWIIMSIEHQYPWWSMTNNIAYQVIAHSELPVLTVHVHTPFTDADS